MPENVTAGLQEHEVELVWEARLRQSQDHTLLPYLLLLFWCKTSTFFAQCLVIERQIEALNQKLATILLRCAKVVAAEDERGIFDLEHLNLQFSPVGPAQDTRFVDFNVHFAVRKVFLYIDDQFTRDLSLVHAGSEGSQLRILQVPSILAQIATASLLEVCYQNVSFFHSTLQVIKRNNELHIVH